MPYSFIQNTINENLCMGDTLPTINTNYVNLDTGLATLSAQHVALKTKYNTLVRTLTGIGSPGTTYNSLSTTFQTLSTLLVP